VKGSEEHSGEGAPLASLPVVETEGDFFGVLAKEEGAEEAIPEGEAAGVV